MTNKITLDNQDINDLLHELGNEMKNIFGEKLKKIIMYGSYARGRNVPGSDLDIMVLNFRSSKVSLGLCKIRV